LIKDLTTIPTMMFTIRERESGSTAHTDIGIDPGGWCACDQEMGGGGNGRRGREVDTGCFEFFVDVGQEGIFGLGFEYRCPSLEILDCHILDFCACRLSDQLQFRFKRIDKLTVDLINADISSTNSLLAISARK
jgi:hypothetical protein